MVPTVFMHSGLWIWIRINFPSWILINIQHADPDPVGKIEQKRKKKNEKCKEIGTGKNCTSIKKFEVNLVQLHGLILSHLFFLLKFRLFKR